jgi:hypothetical protein
MSQIPRITEAEYLGDYRIRLRFSDGEAGIVDLSDQLYGEMFEPLKDMSLFAQFRVYPDGTTIYWPNSADLSPEFLHDKVAKRGGRSAAE